MQTRFLLISIFCLFSLILSGQNTLRFERLSTFNGLGNNAILDIKSDSKGFIWLSTYDGLSRYDGYKFENFRPEHTNPNISGYNVVRVLAPDSEGKIWFGTKGYGLSVFTPSNNNFKSYQTYKSSNNQLAESDVTAICHKNGMVWVGTSTGLSILNPINDSIHNFSLSNWGISDDVTNLLSGPDNSVWVGTTQGLLLLELDNHELKVKDNLAKEILAINQSVNQIYQKSNNQFLLVCPNNLYSIDKDKNNIYQLNKLLNLKDVKSLSAKTDRFKAVVEQSPNHFYLASDEGLISIQIHNNQIRNIKHYQREAFNMESLSGNRVTSLFKDREGIIWVGTRYNGVNKLDPFKQAFIKYVRRAEENSSMHSNDVRSLLEDSNGNIWIGYRNEGLDYYQTKTKTYSHFDINTNPAIPSNTIRAIHEDNSGVIWLGHNGGFSQIFKNDADYNIKTYKQVDGTNIGNVYYFLKDSKDRFWIGSTSGLLLWENNKLLRYLFNSDIFAPNRKNFVRCISEDEEGILWIASDGAGLTRFNPKTKQSINYQSILNQNRSLSHNKVYSLLRDSKQRLWVGTHDGLNLYNKSSNDFTRFTTANGLISNVIYSIQEDNNNRIWLSTPNGLTCLSEDSNKVKIYLRGFEFSDDAWYKNSKGQFYLGGLNGFFKFNPSELITNNQAPLLYLNAFKLQNKEVSTGEEVNNRVLINTQISELDTIELKHYENFFSIELLALSFSKPEQIRYQYQLDGFNSNWIDMDEKLHSAVFTNVPYGEYTFRYRASNSDGVWSEERQLQIVIQPAIYQTLWFKILGSLSILLLIILGYRLRLINLTRQKQHLKIEVDEKTRDLQLTNEAIANQNKLLENQKKEIEEQRDKVVKMTCQIHEADERKIRFFTSISHEIRTPLTLISGPIEKLLESLKQDDHYYSTIKLVERNTHRLLNLVNQLLDFRKIDTGHMPVNPIQSDLAVFSKEVFSSFNSWAKKKNINYIIEFDESDYSMAFDHDVLEKVISNILSNAIKYTQETGSVKMIINKSGDNVYFTVQDNGPGISEELRSSIFKRFYRIKEQKTDKSSGSGIGLTLAKEMAILHGGDLILLDNQQKGCCFQFYIPVIQEVEFPSTLDRKEKEGEFPYILHKEINNDYSVLIIEDNPDLRSFIKDSLDSDNIIEAIDGEEGIELAIEKMPDLIISDVLMPKKNGFEVCRILKEDSRTNHIPIVLLTALGAEEYQITGIDLGADDYIVKPFNHRILAGKVNNIMLARKHFKENFQQRLTTSQKSNDSYWKNELPPFVIKIIELIENNMHQADFGVEELGRLMRVSRSTLYRKLKSITDKSPIEFIREIRIRKAMELLLSDPSLQVSELALKVGFEDTDYFRQCFKNQFGKTPREILRQ